MRLSLHSTTPQGYAGAEGHRFTRDARVACARIVSLSYEPADTSRSRGDLRGTLGENQQ